MSASLVLKEPLVQIRTFQPDDWDSIKFVILSILQEWGFLPSDQDQQELKALQSNPDYFTAFFVAEDPEAFGVVGCAGLVKRNETTCDLRKIYLLKKFRGSGIGQQLLTSCLDYARSLGFERIRFEINDQMLGNNERFYLKNGFELFAEEAPDFPGDNRVYYKTF